LSLRMDRPPGKLSAIFKGEKSMTPETALQLEKVVGVPAHVWAGLESEYRLALARREERQELEKQYSLINVYCYTQLAKIGLCAKTRDKAERLQQLHRFLGVTSLYNVNHVRIYEAAFRCGKSQKGKSPEATTSWLRVGELRARGMECKPFSKGSLEKILPLIRQLILDDGADAINTKLPALLSDVGIAFVLAPHFPGTYANGAAFWLSKEKAVLMATLRYKYADIVWFSVLHEIGHLLLHPGKMILECTALKDKTIEDEANSFAANFLNPPEEYGRFVRRGDFSASAIIAYSDAVKIHPGIVVGRLQHEERIAKGRHKELRRKYEWALQVELTRDLP